MMSILERSYCRYCRKNLVESSEIEYGHHLKCYHDIYALQNNTIPEDLISSLQSLNFHILYDYPFNKMYLEFNLILIDVEWEDSEHLLDGTELLYETDYNFIVVKDNKICGIHFYRTSDNTLSRFIKILEKHSNLVEILFISLQYFESSVFNLFHLIFSTNKFFFYNSNENIRIYREIVMYKEIINIFPQLELDCYHT